MTDNTHAIDNAKGWLATIRDLAARIRFDDEEVSEEARQEASESALSVQVRSGWYTPGEPLDASPEEYEVLLTTGGPALRITGDLNGSPSNARLQWQDWFQPWTDYDLTDAELADVLAFVSVFWFGE